MTLILTQHLLATGIHEISELLHRSVYVSYLPARDRVSATNKMNERAKAPEMQLAIAQQQAGEQTGRHSPR